MTEDEECTPQHKLLVCNTVLKMYKVRKEHRYVPRRKGWKLKESHTKYAFMEFTRRIKNEGRRNGIT